MHISHDKKLTLARALARLVQDLPAEVLLSRQEDVDLLHRTFCLVKQPRGSQSVNHRSAIGSSVRRSAVERRSLELFDVACAHGVFVVVGWGDLTTLLGLKESTLRVRFSAGGGRFSLSRGELTYQVIRTGRYALTGEKTSLSRL